MRMICLSRLRGADVAADQAGRLVLQGAGCHTISFLPFFLPITKSVEKDQIMNRFVEAHKTYGRKTNGE